MTERALFFECRVELTFFCVKRVLTLQRPHLSRHPVMKSAQRPTHHYRMSDHQSCRPAALETSDLSSRHAHFLFVSSSTARISSSKICTSSNLYSSFFWSHPPIPCSDSSIWNPNSFESQIPEGVSVQGLVQISCN